MCKAKYLVGYFKQNVMFSIEKKKYWMSSYKYVLFTLEI